LEYFSEDPIGFEAGDANLSRYVGNDPTRKTDPQGLAEQEDPYRERSNAWYDWVNPFVVGKATSRIMGSLYYGGSAALAERGYVRIAVVPETAGHIAGRVEGFWDFLNPNPVARIVHGVEGMKHAYHRSTTTYQVCRTTDHSVAESATLAVCIPVADVFFCTAFNEMYHGTELFSERELDWAERGTRGFDGSVQFVGTIFLVRVGTQALSVPRQGGLSGAKHASVAAPAAGEWELVFHGGRSGATMWEGQAARAAGGAPVLVVDAQGNWSQATRTASSPTGTKVVNIGGALDENVCSRSLRPDYLNVAMEPRPNTLVANINTTDLSTVVGRNVRSLRASNVPFVSVPSGKFVEPSVFLRQAQSIGARNILVTTGEASESAIINALRDAGYQVSVRTIHGRRIITAKP